MIPKSAIEKASSGGFAEGYLYRGVKDDVGAWKAVNQRHIFLAKDDITKEQYKGYSVLLCSPQEIALDPTFWQALGKALGWNKHSKPQHRSWLKPAHRYYDLILTGGDTEKFWQELLAKK